MFKSALCWTSMKTTSKNKTESDPIILFIFSKGEWRIFPAVFRTTVHRIKLNHKTESVGLDLPTTPSTLNCSQATPSFHVILSVHMLLCLFPHTVGAGPPSKSACVSTGLVAGPRRGGPRGLQRRGSEGDPSTHLALPERRLPGEHQRRHGPGERHQSPPGPVPEEHRWANGTQFNIFAVLTHTFGLRWHWSFFMHCMTPLDPDLHVFVC